MKAVGRTGSLLCAIYIAFTTATLARETPSGKMQCKTELQANHNVLLPKGIQKYLREKTPDYVPVTKADYEQVWFEEGRDDIPHWSAAADYDGNGKVDYAVLMKRDNDVALVVVRVLRNRYRHDILRVEESDSPVTLVVNNVEPGWTNVSAIDDPDPQMKYLKNPSLQTGILETCSSYRHYWEDGKWHETYIGA